jgi:hypothetical protein
MTRLSVASFSGARGAAKQGDLMSLWKKSPKMMPNPFFVKINT